MSISLVAHIWRDFGKDLDPDQKLVLMMIADSCGPTGSGLVSLKKLARKCRISSERLQEIIRFLLSSGIVIHAEPCCELPPDRFSFQIVGVE